MVSTGIGGGQGDDLFDKPVMTANTSSEVEISCNIGGAFRDNYVDFGADSEESEEEKTLEMGTSYDPPEPE